MNNALERMVKEMIITWRHVQYYRQVLEGTGKQPQNEYWRYSVSHSNLESEKVRSIRVSSNL